ncbi:type II secretion system protein [Chloroflexota bacterium]
MKKTKNKLNFNERGFTIIELLVVVAILGFLSAVAGIYSAKLLDSGKTESYNTELHNIQTAVASMLSESSLDNLDSAHSNISDMDLVTTDSGNKILSSYLKKIDSNGNVLSGCTYDFTVDGQVTLATTP